MNEPMDLVRLEVNLNQETAAALKAAAARSGITFTEAIRRAVAILSYVEEQTDSGRIIQTMDPNGRNKRELVLM